MLKYLNAKRQRGSGSGRGGQSTLEYAILVIIIIGALLSIQVYIKRGVQGRLKSSADDIGDQFSPDNTYVRQETITNGTSRDTFTKGVTSSILKDEDEVTQVTTNSKIVDIDKEDWD